MNLISSILCSAALLASPQGKPAQPPAPAAPMMPTDPHAGHRHFNDPSEVTPDQKMNQESAKRLTEKDVLKYLAYEREALLGNPAKALAASKLDRRHADQLAKLVRPYFLARQAARRDVRELAEVRDRIAKARAGGAEPVQADLDRERMLKHAGPEHDTWRTKWTTTYGDKTRELLDKQEDAFVALYDESDARIEKAEAETKAFAAQGLDEERMNRYIAFHRGSPPPAGPAREKALAAAQLDERTVHGITLLGIDYLRRRIEADQDTNNLADARQRLADAKAKGKQAGFEERLEKYFVDRLADYATFRKQFAAKYGEQVPNLFDKFFGELSKVVVTRPQLPPGFAADDAKLAAPAKAPAAPATTPKK